MATFNLVVVIYLVAQLVSVWCECPSEDGIEINQKGTALIKTGLYELLYGSVNNMYLVASATKHVFAMRGDPSTINPDPGTDASANPIQNLLFDLFVTTDSDKSIFMGYSNKRFVAYRVRPERAFDFYETSTGVLNSYIFDSTSGRANTDNPQSEQSSFDVTSRPWFTEAI